MICPSKQGIHLWQRVKLKATMGSVIKCMRCGALLGDI